MLFRLSRRGLLGLLTLLTLASAARAEVKLPGIFGNQMVLQRDIALPVWGWAEPGETVKVAFGSQSKTATADAQGKWSVTLNPVKAGGPFTLRVQGSKNTIEKTDILVGEVWLCSGQSNMAMTVGGVLNKDAEIAASDYPKIRLFTVPRKTAVTPQDNCGGDWKVCGPKTVPGFSAAAYFFGRRLHQELGVPVGLIDSSWGGTPIQAWTSLNTHQASPDLQPMLENLKKAIASWNPEAASQRFKQEVAKWEAAAAKAKAEGKEFKVRKPREPIDPQISQGSPARLYNGMIAPLAPYALRGAIWYQGEANAGNAALYGKQLPAMIANWRADWHQGDFPFLFVQLPNFMAPQVKPSETNGWPLMREQFFKTLAVPGAGMAVTIDVGEADDIHPKNKQEVGKRLAQWALAKVYGKPILACGPLYRSMQASGGKIAVSFDYADGLKVKGDKLKGFAIAGDDKKFVWADAMVVGKTVVVSSPEVPKPAAVRYAWANNPECNLYNGADLPASPFRTDDWAE